MTAHAAAPGGPDSAFAGRPPAPPPVHVTFHPVVDVETGTVVAVAPSVPAHAAAPGPGSDVARALLAAGAAARHETPLPLLLAVHPPTLGAGPDLDRLHRGLAGLGRRPGGVIVAVTGALDGTPPDEALARLGRLRTAGYLLAVEAADLPGRLLAEAAPAVLILPPGLGRRATADQRYSALVAAFVALARGIGGHVLAPGVVSDDQFARLRTLGVRLVQGPLLAARGWLPGMAVSVPVVSGDAGRDRLGPRVTEFMMPATLMPDTATADDVLSAFTAEPATTSVVLVDPGQRPRHTVDRTRFLLRLAGAYGHALHAHRPAARLADAPRTVPRTVPAIAALRAAGDDAERVYDDLVVVDEVGRCLGVARVGDLIRSLSALDRH